MPPVRVCADGVHAADVVDALHAMWVSAASRLPRDVAPRRAVIVELVGPAGAGKTTLRRALAAAMPNVRAGVRIARTRDLRATLADIAAQGPVVMDAARRRGVVAGWREGTQLARLRALHRSVVRARRGGHTAVVLDEGPVFALAKLHVAWGGLPAESHGTRAWQSAVAQWRNTIDIVVTLDAPDAVLAARICGRAKPHRMKDAPAHAVADFLQRYRAAYQFVLERLCAGGGPTLLAIDGTAPPHAAVPALARMLGTAGATVGPGDADACGIR